MARQGLSWKGFFGFLSQCLSPVRAHKFPSFLPENSVSPQLSTVRCRNGVKSKKLLYAAFVELARKRKDAKTPSFRRTNKEAKKYFILRFHDYVFSSQLAGLVVASLCESTRVREYIVLAARSSFSDNLSSSRVGALLCSRTWRHPR